MKFQVNGSALLSMLLLFSCSSPTHGTAVSDSVMPATGVATFGLPVPSIAFTSITCIPTFSDELSPSYKPNSPLRSIVGHGHIVTGTVRSGKDCTAVPHAKLEFWTEKQDAGHPDEYRATFFTNSDGVYRFECSTTDHIHMRITADGYLGIASNAYHTDGKPTGTFDIVLVPKNP